MKLKSRLGLVLRRITPLNHRTFDLVRFELGCIRERLLNRLSPRYHLTIARLRSQTELSINVGSGGRGKPGWVNLDVWSHLPDVTFSHDIRRPLPLPANCARRIFAEHVVEHLDILHEVPGVLAEFHRLLRPAGVVRIIVPDVSRYLEAYLNRDWEKWKALGWDRQNWPADILTPMHAVNHVFHQEGEHYFGYDYETLQLALTRAGFGRIEQMSFGRSLDPELAIDRLEHAGYSIYVDAVK